jgi:hypothetical protein
VDTVLLHRLYALIVIEHGTCRVHKLVVVRARVKRSPLSESAVLRREGR